MIYVDLRYKSYNLKEKPVNMKKYYQKFLAILIATGALILMVSGCSKNNKASTNKLSIVTSTNVYANIAQNVLGKYGKATAIITNSSTDPHDFEPTTADAKKFRMQKSL